MPFPISLNQESYEALVALARAGAQDPDTQRKLESFLVNLETANGITRYLLWVRWQEADQPLPATVRFPDSWPPNLQYLIQRTDRPIIQADVQSVVAAKASNPVSVMVTQDPGALVGWTQIAAFFAAR